jgi:glycosyltransferase involved in cell wall biosynthesis
MNLSVVIPLINEQNSLEELVSSISSIINEINLNYEIILIDDGSTDKSWKLFQNYAL